MARLDSKRRTIFGKYSANWKYLKPYLDLPQIPNDVDIYVCPICLTAFDESGLNLGNSPHLTLEDVPPKAMGGKAKILTCNNCNNEAGFKLDSHLVKQTAAEDFFARKAGASVKASFNISEKSTIKGIIANHPNNTIGMYFDKKSNPVASQEIKELSKNWSSGTIKLTVKGGIRKSSNVAKLRIAYLMAFEKFGYGFIMNANQHEIRRQILNPLETIVDNLGIINITQDNIPNGVYFIRRPKDLMSYLVNFDLIVNKIKTPLFVVLPGPTEEGKVLYKTIAQRQKFEDINFISFKDINYLGSKDHVLTPYKCWNFYQDEE